MPAPHLLSPAGFRAAGVAAGIKPSGRPDIALLACDRLAAAAATFTTNRVVAAPVVVGRAHVRGGTLSAVVVNSGNANACTGAQGDRDARATCKAVAKLLGCTTEEVLPSSTGVIGHPLPMPKLLAGVAAAHAQLGDSAEHAAQFTAAIMTTDAYPKSAGVTFTLGGTRVALAGVAKGAGMIGPRMAPPQATMLAYLTTDAAVAAPVLRKLLAPAVDLSFNAITVDDHASTNDTALVLASGASGAKVTSVNARVFGDALNEVCLELAKLIAADGEGAEKLVTVRVTGAASVADAKRIARAICVSPLVKCAMHGNDPNWGRIVSAAGNAGAAFDASRATLKLQGVVVFRAGRPRAFDAAATSAKLKEKHVSIALDCGTGEGDATMYTCDLGHEYVRINADYTT